MTSELHIFVEGKDDKLLLKLVLEKCHKQYHPSFYKFSGSDFDLVRAHIQKLRQDNDFHILVTDKDRFTSITLRKQDRSETFGIDENNVIVVDSTIESWYVSGSDPSIIDLSDRRSETINKSEFDKSIGGKVNHSNIMKEIIEDFDTNKAIQKNKSFKYFYQQLKTIIGDI